MKKITALAILVFTTTILVKAQTLDFGVKAGLNFSELSNNRPDLYSSTSGATGFLGGVYGRVGLLGFFAQPEVVYSQRKGAFTSKVDQTAVINTLSYIDVPVLFGFKLVFARAYVGPNFQFLMDAKQKATSAAKDPNFSKDNYNSSSVGYQAGIGVDLLKLSLDLRYDGNFGSLGKSVNVAGQNFDYSTRASMWQVSLGFKIF
jgi:hypothetical protein